MKKTNDERKLNVLAEKKEGIAVPVADTAQVMPEDYSLFI